ncbi:MAG: hypothetical protein HY226_02060, partial [Candidatus Vogelbacteria bacterium]|nr:hypothetical protein [Candidatus Vogelbacteria bacterium]
MKETFRKNLDVYGKLASEKLKHEDKELKRVINWHINDAAKNGSSNVLTQLEIFELQTKKQKIIADLKSEIKNLENSKYKPEKTPEQREVTFKNNQYYTTSGLGEISSITQGEILTDLEWGISYYLDPEIIPRSLRKRYLIEKAKHELYNLLTKQITKDAIGNRDTDSYKKQAYGKILERTEGRAMPPGILGETIVKNLLKKAIFDNNLDIEIVDADAQQDVEAKIDFIIQRKKNVRGVKVETNETERIGIQFTTNPGAILHKEQQIKRVKERVKKEEKVIDILLVTIPLEVVLESHYKWKETGMPPGGPDKLLSVQNKKTIFFSLLHGIIPAEEINRKWQDMFGEINDSNSKQVVNDTEISLLFRRKVGENLMSQALEKASNLLEDESIKKDIATLERILPFD